MSASKDLSADHGFCSKMQENVKKTSDSFKINQSHVKNGRCQLQAPGTCADTPWFDWNRKLHSSLESAQTIDEQPIISDPTPSLMCSCWVQLNCSLFLPLLQLLHTKCVESCVEWRRKDFFNFRCCNRCLGPVIKSGSH